ncbi:unnamed protein product [Sympodiomycopsis kandeliae]
MSAALASSSSAAPSLARLALRRQGQVLVSSSSSSRHFSSSGYQTQGEAGTSQGGPSASSSSSQSQSQSTPPPFSSSSLTQLRPIPTAAEILSGVESGAHIPPSRIKPAVAEYYTGRPKYVKFLIDLEDVTRQCRRALESMYVLEQNGPPPSQKEVAAAVGLPSTGRRAVRLASASMWISKDKMSSSMGVVLKASQYRAVADGLTTLAKYAPLANYYLGQNSTNEQHAKIVERVNKMLDEYRKDTSVNASMKTFFTSKTGVDEEGRIWAKGGRKNGKALVYIAPVMEGTEDQSVVPLGQVMVNKHSMSEYFSQIKHREAILHPLRLTHLLGQFNIFAITSGGGQSGQSGAISHGVAKAILRYYEEMEASKILQLEEYSESNSNSDSDSGESDPELMRIIKEKEDAENISNSVRRLLSKDGVLKRDPRMVERKKTGKAKARTAYTWVKR